MKYFHADEFSCGVWPVTVLIVLWNSFYCLIGHIPGSNWWGVNLSLCAINMAEAAGDALPLSQLAEIYATCAIRVQTSLPWKMKYLSVNSSFCFQDRIYLCHTDILMMKRNSASCKEVCGDW
jgi:hypothetical protein